MIKIYNTLSRKVEEFKPIDDPVGIYSCGPTVYDYQHIGHMRRYVGDDILISVLKHSGFKIHHVMNITDVGHLVSDADEGEDKMEKGAKKFGMSVWDIAKKFEKQFKDSCEDLNIKLPKDLMRATDFIPDQIDLIKKLEEKGFTYKTQDGVYFDTSKFPDYFKLSRQNPSELRGGIRVDLGAKKNITDFALWKFSPKNEKRQMEWESPWGVGFPGWHIECAAMSMKALGPTFSIHTGGIDHINIHHTNEIAEAEAATGKDVFAKYWVHHAFLTVDGQKMSKSLGNAYTMQNVIEKGFDPLALRYLYLQTHYRQEMNFTWEALEGAQNAFNKLRKHYLDASGSESEVPSEFEEAINDDLNMPKALSAVWDNVQNLSKDSFSKIDEILGLKLSEHKEEKVGITTQVQKLIDERGSLRKEGKFEDADRIRAKIEEQGFVVEDSDAGPIIHKK